jgi:hypothetical protein
MLAGCNPALLRLLFLVSAPTSLSTDTRFQIDVRNASDVQTAYMFSLATGVHLSIKNSGHDYKGRASGRDTLALWVRLV